LTSSALYDTFEKYFWVGFMLVLASLYAWRLKKKLSNINKIINILVTSFLLGLLYTHLIVLLETIFLILALSSALSH